MGSKRSSQTDKASPVKRPTTWTGSARSADRPGVDGVMDSRARIGVLVVAMVLVTAAVIAADFAFGALSGSSATAAPTPTPAVTPVQVGMVVQGRGGQWTNVTADQLADMLTLIQKSR